MEAPKHILETKLTQFRITRDKTKAIGTSRVKSRIERQKDTLRTLGISAEEAKRELQEKKIAAGEELDEVITWADEVETKIAAVEEDIDYLAKCLGEIEQAEINQSRKPQLEFEKELLEQKLHFKDLEANQTQSVNPGTSQSLERNVIAKLPKLSIKLNGTYLDWRRFWSQFMEEIDKSGMAPITKFSYLKEFVEPKVRKIIDVLPFTPEGYNRAKSILQDCYGKESEIVKAYVKDMDLPLIDGVHLSEIHQFYERLLYDVQSLETMRKLQQVNGNVSLTIDKLSGIRGDLARNDDNWQDNDFFELCEALRSGTRRNPLQPQQQSEKNNRRRTGAYTTRQ